MKRNPANTSHVDVSTHFDQLARLSKSDPEAFERLRLSLLEAFLSEAPPEKIEMLERLQWRIEQERKRSKNPLSSYLAISKMMWDSLLSLRDFQQDLIDIFRDGEPPKAARFERKAEIIPISSRMHKRVR